MFERLGSSLHSTQTSCCNELVVPRPRRARPVSSNQLSLLARPAEEKWAQQTIGELMKHRDKINYVRELQEKVLRKWWKEPL
jgi:hypothetical protein